MKAIIRHSGKTLKVYLGTPKEHGLEDSEDGEFSIFTDTKQAFIDAQVCFMNSGNAIDYSDIPSLLRKQAQ
jgi:hypothetical protein